MTLFSGQHFRDPGHRQLRYIFDVFLTIISIELFRLMASQQRARRYRPPPLPSPLPPSSSSSGVAPVGETMIKDKKQEVQRDVDMMSTTVGGTTVQGSTGDVPEAGEQR